MKQEQRPRIYCSILPKNTCEQEVYQACIYKSDLPPQGLPLFHLRHEGTDTSSDQGWKRESRERLAEPGDRARERPLNEKYPQRFNFPEGPNQVLGTKLNEVSKNKSLQRVFTIVLRQQPAKRRMIRGEHRSRKADSVPAGFRVKRWLRHGLPRRSRSRGKSERGGKVADLFFPRPSVGVGFTIWKRALKEKKMAMPE